MGDDGEASTVRVLSAAEAIAHDAAASRRELWLDHAERMLADLRE